MSAVEQKYTKTWTMINIQQPRIGVFSDIHLGNYRDDPKWHLIADDLSKWIAQQYRQRGITDIIIPGDIFHNRFEVSVTTLNAAKRFFDNLREFNIIITIGNHDAFYRDRSDVNSLAIFDEWSNITVVSEFQLVEQHDVRIGLCPWAYDVSQLPACDVVFGHFEIAGFHFAPSKICTTGVESTKLLSRSPLIISGHFHMAAERKYNGGVVKYVGTPYQLNWAEAGDSKFIYILDLRTMKFETIENDVSPKHIRIKMSDWITNQVDRSIVKGNIINMIMDVSDDKAVSDTNELSAHKFTTEVLGLGPVDYRTTYVTNNASAMLFDKEFDGVDVLSSMREFIDLLDIKSEIKPLVINKIVDLYMRNQ